ncbi:MAG: Ephrin type-A receptor 2, partial [Paramarteilia canceri]
MSEYFDPGEGQCKSCRNVVTNSSGRLENSFSYGYSCSCSNDKVKLKFSDQGSKCIDEDDLKGLKHKITDALLKSSFNYAEYNIVTGQDEIILFMYCNPFERYTELEIRCLCNEGFQFSNGKCKPCLKPSNVENLRDYKCQFCPEGTIISDDHKKCMCQKGYYPQKGE